MKRDTNAAKELNYLASSTSRWCARIGQWAVDAATDGAEQHSTLYSDIANHLDQAVEELRQAADLMNPKITEIETYQGTSS